MDKAQETSDERLLDLLRNRGPLSVLEMVDATCVTATAVRQRLTRLMQQEMVQRDASPRGRGRPSHRYSLTEKARRQAGSNFADLALVLWQEIRGVKDQEVRRGLLNRIADGMAAMYRSRMQGKTVKDRMQSLAGLFAERRVPLELGSNGELPVLTVRDCPYPELAEMDRGICAMEKMLFSRLLEQDVKLTACRLDGHACCQFETSSTGILPVEVSNHTG
jgi:DeoR family suf operon transcriptional repressor